MQLAENLYHDFSQYKRIYDKVLLGLQGHFQGLCLKKKIIKWPMYFQVYAFIWILLSWLPRKTNADIYL